MLSLLKIDKNVVEQLCAQALAPAMVLQLLHYVLKNNCFIKNFYIFYQRGGVVLKLK